MSAKHPLAHAFLPILILTVIWGCNWPVLKMGVAEIAPLTFRALTLPFAAIGMLIVARLSGDSIRIPRGDFQVTHHTTVDGTEDTGVRQPREDVTGTLDLNTGTATARPVASTASQSAYTKSVLPLAACAR